MKAQNPKACHFLNRHFPSKKARRISFIPFLLLLCILTTLAGCQSKRPFTVAAEKGIVPSLSRTIYMTDGTTREMAENVVTESTGMGDPFPVWDAFTDMYQADNIVLFEVLGFVSMGASPGWNTSLLQVKVVSVLVGNLQPGDIIYIGVPGTATHHNQQRGYFPVSIYQPEKQFLMALYRAKSIIPPFRELLQAEDPFYLTYAGSESSFQIIELDGVKMAIKDAVRYQKIEPVNVDEELQPYRKDLTLQQEQQAAIFMEETRTAWRESSSYIIISYEKMLEFYDDLVIPAYNEMKEQSRE